MNNTELMKKHYDALVDRAMTFYPAGISTNGSTISVEQTETILTITHTNSPSKRYLIVELVDVEGMKAVFVSTSGNQSINIRVLCEDPEFFKNYFHALDGAVPAVFVTTTTPLNKLIRNHSLEDVKAYEASSAVHRAAKMAQKEAMKRRRAENAQAKRDRKDSNRRAQALLEKESQLSLKV